VLAAQRDPKALLCVLASELHHVVTCNAICIVLYDEVAPAVHFHVLEITHRPDIGPPADLPPEKQM
jgi:hypothetical protein